jgi:hypothetical protein
MKILSSRQYCRRDASGTKKPKKKTHRKKNPKKTILYIRKNHKKKLKKPELKHRHGK